MRRSGRHLVWLASTGAILLATAGCGNGDGSTGPHGGSLRVTVTSEGTDIPANAYRILVDGSQGPTVPVNGSAEVTGLVPGEHEVVLAGVPRFCATESQLTRTVAVRSDSATQIDYLLTCVRRIMYGQGVNWPAILHLVRSDGTGGDTVLDLPSLRGANDAVWSPDGASIAFWSVAVSAPDTVLPDIYTMDLGTNVPTQLTSNMHSEVNPAWSPDGRRIAFTRGAYTGFSVLTMDADGTNVTALTDSTVFARHPTWSPDGNRIAYTNLIEDPGNPGSGKFQLWIMNADGSAQTLVADDADLPVWSPDGSRIVFESTRDSKNGGRNIYVLTLDDSSTVRLTHDAGSNHEPAWSPDGSRIVFVSNREGSDAIYTMHADGSHVMRVTDLMDSAWSPSWEP